MKIYFYYEIYRSKKYTSTSDWSNYDFDSMGIMEGDNPIEIFDTLKEQIKAANELAKESMYKYQVRNLREI